MPRTTTTTRTSTNRQLDETSTTRQLDNKHEQKWQGHHNSENQLLWALITQVTKPGSSNQRPSEPKTDTEICGPSRYLSLQNIV